jgi:hypothetical protein
LCALAYVENRDDGYGYSSQGLPETKVRIIVHVIFVLSRGSTESLGVLGFCCILLLSRIIWVFLLSIRGRGISKLLSPKQMVLEMLAA